MELSHKLRKRFVKDNRLPISVFRDPYFNYFLDMYEKEFSSMTKYCAFKELVEKLGGEQDFFIESK